MVTCITWLPTAPGPGDRNGTIDYCEFDEPAALVWAANMAAIELHAPMALAADLGRLPGVLVEPLPGPQAYASFRRLSSAGESAEVVLDATGQRVLALDGVTSLGWNAYEIQQTMLALQQYSNVCNLTFAVTSNAAAATFHLVTDTSNEYLAYFNPPGTTNEGVGVFAAGSQGQALG